MAEAIATSTDSSTKKDSSADEALEKVDDFTSPCSESEEEGVSCSAEVSSVSICTGMPHGLLNWCLFISDQQ